MPSQTANSSNASAEGHQFPQIAQGVRQSGQFILLQREFPRSTTHCCVRRAGDGMKWVQKWVGYPLQFAVSAVNMMLWCDAMVFSLLFQVQTQVMCF